MSWRCHSPELFICYLRQHNFYLLLYLPNAELPFSISLLAISTTWQKSVTRYLATRYEHTVHVSTMRRTGSLNIPISAYQAHLLVQVLCFYDFPFWLIKFTSCYPREDVKTWCGSSRSISNELRNSVSS